MHASNALRHRLTRVLRHCHRHDSRGTLTRGLFYGGGMVTSIVDFEYDRANTLQRITGLDPSIGEQRYRYDAHGHRIDVHTAVGQFNEARHWPVYTRDGTLRGEYRPASGVGAGPNDQYYYLGTQLIARRRGAADVSWFLTNHIGSNVATTDAFGNEIENSRFTPYGERHAKVLERGPAYAGHFGRRRVRAVSSGATCEHRPRRNYREGQFAVERSALYDRRMIRSFRCADTQALFETGRCRRFSRIASVAVRRLAQLDAAHELRDLRSPPGNRLEVLRGDRAGQHSIRVNDQFRICFVWVDQHVEQVEIVDYH